MGRGNNVIPYRANSTGGH